MKKLGLLATLCIVLVGAGCSLESGLVPPETSFVSRVLEPAKKLTDPSEIANQPNGFFRNFESSGCTLNQTPGGTCVPEFVVFDTNAKVVQPASFGSTATSGARGVINNVNGPNEDIPLTINFTKPILKIGFFLLPRPADGEKAVLTGYDANSKKVTSASLSIPNSLPVFLGISSTREITQVTLKYNAGFAELIDDLYIVKACASVLAYDPKLSLTVNGSSVKATAYVTNQGNVSARDIAIEFKLYLCPSNTCPNLNMNPAAFLTVIKTISRLGINRNKKVSFTFTSLNNGKYLVGYVNPFSGAYQPLCTSPNADFISEEVQVD